MVDGGGRSSAPESPPCRSRIPTGTAVASHQTLLAQSLEPLERGLTAHPHGLRHIGGPERPRRSQEHHDVDRGPAEAIGDRVRDPGGGIEPDDNTGRRLAIHRIAEPRTPHPIHHAANPLAQLLGVAEIGADPGNTRITRVPGDFQRPGRIDEARETTRGGDLDAAGEDGDADMISSHRVGAVNDRVDDRLRPRLARNDINRAEAPLIARRLGAQESTSAREASMTSGIAPSRRRSPSTASVCLEPVRASSAWYRSTRTKACGR